MKTKSKTLRMAMTAVALATGGAALTVGGVALADLSVSQSNAAGQLTQAQRDAASNLSLAIASAVSALGANPTPDQVDAAVKGAIQAATDAGVDAISINLGLAEAASPGQPLAALAAANPTVAGNLQTVQTTVLSNAVAQAIAALPPGATTTQVQNAMAAQITAAGASPTVVTNALTSGVVTTAAQTAGVTGAVNTVTAAIQSGQFTVASTSPVTGTTGSVVTTPPPVVVVPIYVG